MVRLTEDLVRKRAEHNEGMLSTLEEVALHQQNIEKIEMLGQCCPHLKILYLQNNLIPKIQNLHKLKELEYLNLAVNNVTKIQNLQRCESLTKLDLTINFVDIIGLLTVPSLVHNIALKELYLLGNPCTEWSGYRPYVIAKVPQVKKLDGHDIKHSERIAALQVVDQLEQELRGLVAAKGVDPDRAAEVEDDSLDLGADVPETGYINEAGELVRPWCPATRILDHRENEAASAAADEAKRKGREGGPSLDAPTKPAKHTSFPTVEPGELPTQRNEGRWDFTLDESDDGVYLELEVDVGRYLDTALIQADVQPRYVQLLIKGRLLCLVLPAEVRPDAAVATRIMSTGALLLRMPKEDPSARVTDVAHLRPKVAGETATRSKPKSHSSSFTQHATLVQSKKTLVAKSSTAILTRKDCTADITREVRKAVVHSLEGNDDQDQIPDL